MGLRLDGAAVLDAAGAMGRVGRPVWGPAGLLRDLELRLGVAVMGAADEAVRVQRWAGRLARLVHEEPFYARSFRVDPLGTARMTLAWRDGLVAAGWGGGPVVGGGPRLEMFARLEAMAEPVLPAAAADRLAAVEVEVALLELAPYAELVFAEDRRAWPYRWQRVFDLLAERGTVLTERPRLAAGLAAAGTDLARLQGAIAGTGADAGERVRGDGSLVLLRAATTLEAADAVAAMLGGLPARRTVMVRPAQETVLDEALTVHGVPTLGARAGSPWRAALQVLPLALELLFEPVDPRRVLDLLGLPVSPFGRRTRYMLSAALVDSPGIGGPRWREAKRRLHEQLAAESVTTDAAAPETEPVVVAVASEGEPDAPAAVANDTGAAANETAAVANDTVGGRARADRELALIEAWLESARFEAVPGAPKAVIVEAAGRVREWLGGRMASGHEGGAEAAAYGQCEQLLALVGADGRERLPRLALRQLLDEVTAAGAAAEVMVEQAGRVDHVDHPGGLLAPRDVVIWWHFTSATAKPPHRARWRKVELDALAACGVHPDDPAALLAQEARWWSGPVLAARERLVLVLPETDRGERTAPHPLWDEIVARLGLGDEPAGALAVNVSDLLAERTATTLPCPPPTEPLAPLPLPAARPTWRVAPGLIAAARRWTPVTLQHLLECPLRWVLGGLAGARGATVPSLAAGPLLNGSFGHRLLEELLATGGLARPAAEVLATIDRLLPEAGAWLLQPGLALELQQLRHQLVSGVEALAELLERAGLTIAAVEEATAGDWLGGTLDGRMDLRLVDGRGADVILDVKWGHGSYRSLLEEGRAVQLAFYARARRPASSPGDTPPVAYFSLARGRLLATDPAALGLADVPAVRGPDIRDTIAAIEETAPRVQAALAAGQIHVTGLAESGSLLDRLGVPAAEHDRHYRVPPRRPSTGKEPPGCQYCDLGPVCGRPWERGP